LVTAPQKDRNRDRILHTSQNESEELKMPAIDTLELKSMLDRGEDLLLVNTLPEDQFEKTKIPGAVNIPQAQSDFAQQVEEHAESKEQTIVVYCANIDCDSSTQAAAKLDQAGFKNVFDYRVGAKGWRGDRIAEDRNA
jgi:rhodanese-related sulfurtransferase